MGALIKLELHNLFRQKSFYVCAGITAALAVIFYLIWAYTPLQLSIGNIFEILQRGEWPEKTSSGFAATLSILSLLSDNYPLVLGIAMVSFFVPDYTQNTIKNVYARGFSRTQIFFAKYITALIMTISMLLMIFIFSFVTGTIQFGIIDKEKLPIDFFIGKFLAFLGGEILVAVTFASVEFALCMMIKNIPGALVLIFVVTTIIPSILSVVGFILIANDISFQPYKYYLTSFISDLCDQSQLFLGGKDVSWARYAGCTLGALAYGAAMLAIGWAVNLRSEK